MGSRYIGNPGGILCEGQAIQNLGQSECHTYNDLNLFEQVDGFDLYIVRS